MRKVYFDLGEQVLTYEAGQRVYGTVYSYPADDENLVTLEILDEDGEVDRYLTLREDYVRHADDPDDPEED